MVRVLEVLVLLKQWGLIDVIVSRDAVVVGYLGKLSHIVQVIATDIDVEEDREAVSVLLADEVIELLADRDQGLRQARFQIHGIDGDIESRDTRISKLVDYVGAQ